jgi:hypothetical protein
MFTYLLWILPTVYTAYRPFVAITYCLHCLPFVVPFNPLWLLSIVYSAGKPFVVIAYDLQQRHLPYKLQISCLLLCYCLLMVAIVLWQKVFSILKTTIENGNV